MPRESIADTHTSSLGQRSDSTEPCALSYATQPHPGQSLVCNRMRQSRYEQRNLSQSGYSASTDTKMGSPYRSMARSAGLASGIDEVVSAGLLQTKASYGDTETLAASFFARKQMETLSKMPFTRESGLHSPRRTSQNDPPCIASARCQENG